MTSRHKAALFALALVALALSALLLPVEAWLIAGVDLIDANPRFAWPIYIAAYIVATVLFVPGTILTLAAGFVFGLPIGVALVSAGSVLGAASAFLVGRYFARDWVRAKMAGMPRFGALDRAATKDGFLIVLLVRLSPLFPFNATNYGFGLTGVSLRDYFFASWIGMLPGTILYVYIGTLAMNLAELAAGGFSSFAASRYLLIAGFVATLALTALVTHRATRALNEQLAEQRDTRETLR
jgi:uncharacterized membrane protein YdjX (TVP38/TMEM64 family)